MKPTMAVPVALSLSSNRKPLGLSGFTGRFRDDLDMPNSRNKFARVRHFSCDPATVASQGILRS